MTSDPRFDNLNQALSRIIAATDSAMAAIEQMPTEEELTDPMKQAAATAGLFAYCVESQRVISALIAMVGVLAAKTDLLWMVDGPGIPMDQWPKA